MSSKEPTSTPSELVSKDEEASAPKKNAAKKSAKSTAETTNNIQPDADTANTPAPAVQLPLISESSVTEEEEQTASKVVKKATKRSTKKVAKKATKKQAKSPSESPKNAEPASESKEEKDSPKERLEKREPKKKREKKEIILTGNPISVNGLIELAPKGYGFLRCPEKGYSQARDDVFVPPEYVQKHHLRHCMWIDGKARMGPKGLQLMEVEKINGDLAADYQQAPFFEDLKAINPEKRISFETNGDCFTTRVLDLVSPVGRGQRGLIVAPPRSGKTTFLMDIAKSLQERHEDTIHPIFLLVDERPEEVTEFKRQLPGFEMFSSSNDSGNRNHCRVAELCIERAKRLVEEGKHVFILMDSITRLARAYNRNSEGGGKGNKGRGYQSGGIVSGALEIPRRLFAAARNTKEAGSLTILATALINTNSKADEAIFQEFKGTGNMEIVLDRRLADHYIYPAVDIFKSGTRREELILPEMTLRKFHLIRRGLKSHRPSEAMERLLFFLKKFNNNAQMLLEIKG